MFDSTSLAVFEFVDVIGVVVGTVDESAGVRLSRGGVETMCGVLVGMAKPLAGGATLCSPDEALAGD